MTLRSWGERWANGVTMRTPNAVQAFYLLTVIFSLSYRAIANMV